MTGLHYGWWIVISAIFSIFVCLGVGRFALGMLLPAMGEALPLSYVQMVHRLLPRYGERRLIFLSLMLVVTTMLGVSVAKNFLPIAILYGFTGLGSGIALVCTIAIMPHWFTTSWRGRAIGFLSIGFGLAVILAGWAVPWINGQMAQTGWRLGWSGLALVCVPLILFSLVMMRNRFMELGLTPFGGEQEQTDAQEKHDPRSVRTQDILGKVTPRLSIIYFLFGLTYVVYATFIITTLVREHGMDQAKAGQFWIWLGICSLFCGPLFGGFSDRFGRRAGIAASLSFQTFAYALIAFGNGAWSVYASVVL